MIYLDSAATSLIKPRAVARAVEGAIGSLSSPGRGGYREAMAAADTVYECRAQLAELFHAPGPEHIVFTFNATHGLNIAIFSCVSPGDRVVISGFEHNAVTRPLRAAGARVTVAPGGLFDPETMVEGFRRALPGAALAVCTHVSNVFGYILPLEEIAALCREAGVPLVVDASQSAGCLEMDFQALGAAFAAMPGHKGLMGPQGTGVLICGKEPGRPLLHGGTGTDSTLPGMPDYLPERLEAGTHNVAGIAGLLEGVRFVRRIGPEAILRHETELMELLARELERTAGCRVFRAGRKGLQSGVLSVDFAGRDNELVASELGERGIAVRGGLHCAPLAHKTAATLATGTVRFSFSPFTTFHQTSQAAETVRRLLGR